MKCFSLRLFALAVVLPLGLGNCVGARAKTEVTFRDPAFTRGSLNGKTVAVAEGVYGPGALMPNRVQEIMITQDLETLLSALPASVKVVGSKALEQNVGKVWNQALWLKSGSLELNPRQRAQMKSLGMDYVLVVTLPVNSTRERIDRNEVTHTDTTYDDKGNVESCTSSTRYTTQALSFRRVVACHYLYDVASGRNVWRTYGEHTLCRLSERDSSSGYPEPPPFPLPPGESEVVKAISEKVLKKLAE